MSSIGCISYKSLWKHLLLYITQIQLLNLAAFALKFWVFIKEVIWNAYFYATMRFSIILRPFRMTHFTFSVPSVLSVFGENAPRLISTFSLYGRPIPPLTCRQALVARRAGGGLEQAATTSLSPIRISDNDFKELIHHPHSLLNVENDLVIRCSRRKLYAIIRKG